MNIKLVRNSVTQKVLIVAVAKHLRDFECCKNAKS